MARPKRMTGRTQRNAASLRRIRIWIADRRPRRQPATRDPLPRSAQRAPTVRWTDRANSAFSAGATRASICGPSLRLPAPPDANSGGRIGPPSTKEVRSLSRIVWRVSSAVSEMPSRRSVMRACLRAAQTAASPRSRSTYNAAPISCADAAPRGRRPRWGRPGRWVGDGGPGRRHRRMSMQRRYARTGRSFLQVAAIGGKSPAGRRRSGRRRYGLGAGEYAGASAGVSRRLLGFESRTSPSRYRVSRPSPR